MAKPIMVQGTMSNAGKSIFSAGLCRIFKQDGYRTAPFKSQNMALNSFITKDGLEMGRAQVVQAEAAGIEPRVEMNPILLKPTSDKGSQVIVNGEVIGNMSAEEYYKYKTKLAADIMKAYNSLKDEFDIIVIEGAGSPAEINLKENDIVNMGMARMAESPVILVADIDRGGVFASIYGTVMLLEEDEKKLIKGIVINKFRGDAEILKSGLEMIEDKTGIPVIGVVPYLNIDIDDEDSLSERLTRFQAPGTADIAVIRVPRMSNFTDFNVFETIPGVSLRYVKSAAELKKPDMIILPGTKNTMGDLLWLRQCGLEAEILKQAAEGTVVFGICGGYQMLGNKLEDPHCVEHGGSLKGMGLMNMDTIFAKTKTRTQVSGRFNKLDGIFQKLSGKFFSGYEIHMGVTNTYGKPLACIETISGSPESKTDGYQCDNIFGSYIHGIFDEEGIAQTIAECLMERKGIDPSEISAMNAMNFKSHKEKQYDLLADSIRKSVDISAVYKILEAGV